MNSYIEQLNQYLAEQTPNYGYRDAHSLLEMLYYYYCRDNPIENAVIRCQLREINQYLDKLPIGDADEVFYVVTDLIDSHEKEAFLQGIQVGARLANELRQPKTWRP